MCPSCARLHRRSGVCPACSQTLQPAPDRIVAGVVVRSAWLHEGAARRLVHRAKYQGLTAAVMPMAERLASIVLACGDLPVALVPVPRARVRRARYGVDPAVALAEALGRITSIPVSRALRPGVWWSHHAGAGGQRKSPRLALTRPLPPGVALVDDVVTTGATLATAVGLVPGVGQAYTATSSFGHAR